MLDADGAGPVLALVAAAVNVWQGLCVCFPVCCWCCLSQKVGIVGASRTLRHPARASACKIPGGCSREASVPQGCPLGGGEPHRGTALHGQVRLGTTRLERARRARSLQNLSDPLLCEHTLPTICGASCVVGQSGAEHVPRDTPHGITLGERLGVAPNLSSMLFALFEMFTAGERVIIANMFLFIR